MTQGGTVSRLRMVRSLARQGPLLIPGSGPDTAVYRTLMAASLPRLAGHRDHASRALARALCITALGRVPPEERTWMARIEARRRELSMGDTVVRAGFGAGVRSAENEAQDPSIPLSGAAQWMSLTPVWCTFLMRLVRELSPRSCLELGTGFGISGAYQAASLELNGSGMLTTLEGAPDYVSIAEQGFSALGLDKRVDLEVGPITETLDRVAARAAPIDFAFVDADHTEEATLQQFDAMLPHLSEAAIVVFDDVNWESGGMTRAWRAIRGHERTSLGLGFRRIGIGVISGSRY
jgi:predicted O-methyltransferase YrrM